MTQLSFLLVFFALVLVVQLGEARSWAKEHGRPGAFPPWGEDWISEWQPMPYGSNKPAMQPRCVYPPWLSRGGESARGSSRSWWNPGSDLQDVRDYNRARDYEGLFDWVG